jgi:two-component system, sensor histidine kinase
VTVGDIQFAARVRAEQLRVLYRQAPFAVGTGLIVPLPLLVVFWLVVPSRELIAWFSVMCVVALSRTVLLLWYRRAAPPDSELGSWRNYYVLGTFISGCVWGVAGILMFIPHALNYQFFLVFILAGMCTGAVTSLGIYAPAFYAFVVPTLTPYVTMAIIQGDRVHLMAVVAIVFYVLALGFFTRNFSKSLVESLKLRFENVEIVRRLAFEKEQAERANVAKSRFLAAASHDLRQPLHALALFGSALRDRMRDSGLRVIVDKLCSSVEALEGLFDELLDVSKLDAGIVVPEVRALRVQTLFDRIGAAYADEAADKGLRLRCVPTSVVVRSDPVLLERILRNLVANAIRYTDAGGVLIGCRRKGDAVRIDVVDSGVGISRAHMTDIFEEFYQVGNPERDRTKGLGLGLAIVKRLASLLKHEVGVHSAPGRGSVFSITVARDHAGSVEVEAPLTEELIATGLGNALVVVIDDEQAVRESMREVLQQWGARALLAASAEDAQAQLARVGEAPAAIIADYRLRDAENGIDAIRRLQETCGAELPGVLITGDTAPDRLREAEASGYHLLHKPVRPVKLRALLSFLLNA